MPVKMFCGFTGFRSQSRSSPHGPSPSSDSLLSLRVAVGCLCFLAPVFFSRRKYRHVPTMLAITSNNSARETQCCRCCTTFNRSASSSAGRSLVGSHFVSPLWWLRLGAEFDREVLPSLMSRRAPERRACSKNCIDTRRRREELPVYVVA